MGKHYTHLFFDMDNTVTLSRSRISNQMYGLLSRIPAIIAITSGSSNEQMRRQVGDLPLIQMGQNGNHTVDPKRGELWFDLLNEVEKVHIQNHIDQVWSVCNHGIPDRDDLYEDRGSQISFSLYGHNANPDEKKAFDGNFARRRRLLEQFPFVSDTLEVSIGGSTCFDYYRRGRNKGHNIKRLLELLGVDPKSCLYFGDALSPGGNDHTVVGVIETVPVSCPEDTYARLRFMYPHIQ